MKIIYDGLTLNSGTGEAFKDGNGVEWMVTEMSGYDGAPSRWSVQDYTMRHGGVLVNPTYASRPLVLKGITKAPSEATFWVSYNSLLASMNAVRTPKPLIVTEGTTDKTLGVVRATEPRLAIKPGHFVWELSFTALDPLKYGDAETVTIAAGANVDVTNDGNIESLNAVITTAAAGPVSLTVDGVRLSTGTTGVPSGTVFDFRKRSVRGPSDEDLYSAMAPSSSWWDLDPGVNEIMSGASGVGVSLTYCPAWA